MCLFQGYVEIREDPLSSLETKDLSVCNCHFSNRCWAIVDRTDEVAFEMAELSYNIPGRVKD